MGEAFDLLVPDWIDHRGTACVAGDIAYRSGSAERMNVAEEHLASPGLSGSTPVAARRVVIAVALGQSSARLTALLGAVPHAERDELMIGVVKCVSQAPSQELGFWVAALDRIAAASNLANWYRNAWMLFAASRCLAMYRFWRGVDSGRYLSVREIVDEVFAGELWSAARPKVEGYLYAYSANPGSCSPPLLPYGALSLAAVLDARGSLQDSLRSAIVGGVAGALVQSDDEHMERFMAWTDYSSLASEVVSEWKKQRRRAGMLEGVPQRETGPTPTERLNMAEASSARNYVRAAHDVTNAPDFAIALEAIRTAVREKGGMLVSAGAAGAALKVLPNLAKDGWAGSQRFGQFVVDYLPELRYVSTPTPGWVFDPNLSSEEDVPQPVGRN